MIKKCCVCSMIKMDGTWQISYEHQEGTRVTHAYCPSCFAKTMARIKLHFKDKSKKLYDAELRTVMHGA